MLNHEKGIEILNRFKEELKSNNIDLLDFKKVGEYVDEKYNGALWTEDNIFNFDYIQGDGVVILIDLDYEDNKLQVVDLSNGILVLLECTIN